LYTLLDEGVAKSNNSALEVFSKTENGYDRNYLAVTFEDKIYGLVCLNYDHTMLGGHRCFITHLSTIVPDQMSKALDAVVKYVENNI
jgi:hypothetical protein